MTWEQKASDFDASKEERAKREQQERLDELMSNPIVKYLSSLGVKGSLEGIRDEIWEEGVVKGPEAEDISIPFWASPTDTRRFSCYKNYAFSYELAFHYPIYKPEGWGSHHSYYDFEEPTTYRIPPTIDWDTIYTKVTVGLSRAGVGIFLDTEYSKTDDYRERDQFFYAQGLKTVERGKDEFFIMNLKGLEADKMKTEELLLKDITYRRPNLSSLKAELIKIKSGIDNNDISIPYNRDELDYYLKKYLP